MSRKSDYALRAVIQLSITGEEARSISSISAAVSIPRNFAAKILKQLTDAGILKSFSGKNGGYKLAKPKSEISFREIIEAVEGPITINQCLDESSDCGRVSICRMYDAWKNTQDKIVELLEGVKIGDIVSGSREHPAVEYK
ncbi:MAG: Rrf2 family transcriptional regulator [candidate division Zixibacteria bacterium]|nr:Rrf2 family transcriptional regulator [candidate division Zixibacteria bacterium]